MFAVLPEPFRFITDFFGDTPLKIVINAILLVIVLYSIHRFLIQPFSKIGQKLVDMPEESDAPIAILEITPPNHSESAPLATQQLLTVVQQYTGEYGSARLELVSSREEGIRYRIHIAVSDAPVVQRHVAAYLPGARFHIYEGGENAPTLDGQLSAFPVRLARHYAYPLTPQADLSQSDPMAYIAGAMTKLGPDEAIALQITIQPYVSYSSVRLYNKILNKGHALIDRKVQYFLRRFWWVWIAALLIGYYSNNIGFTFSCTVVLLAVAAIATRQEEVVLTEAQRELYQSVLGKLGQPLFSTDIRVAVIAESAEKRLELARGLSGSFAPLASPVQALYVSDPDVDDWRRWIDVFRMYRDISNFFTPHENVLSAAELASIFHFPYGTIQTEGMVRSHSRTLPAPLAVKNGEFDVVLGQSVHHSEVTPIGLTAAERERHVFVIGGTGNGKTTMLEYGIIQDIQNGKGVAIVDPHGDLAQNLLRHIPEHRIKDVIYFNPQDIANPIGLNLLEQPEGLSEDELLLEQDFITESIVSVFRKIFSEDDSGGHRIEHFLRNTIHTAFTVPEATLFTVYKLLTNTKFRNSVVSKLTDEDLVDFWKGEFNKAGDYQKVKMSSGVNAKLGRFQRSVVSRRVLEQPKSTINFDEILDGKILICNFAKGSIGEDTSELFGISILAKLQLAAYRRVRTKQADRKPFYLYVDEFQNFATMSFVQMLSEARKYKVFLTMAEQSTSQQEDQQMVNTILANVGTVICFRSGNPADEKLLLPLFKPYVEEGEIANLPTYNFYARMSAVLSQEPVSGETVMLEGEGSEEVTAQAIAASRIGYAKKYEPPKSGNEKSTKPKVERKAAKHASSLTGKPSEY